jgi:L,D-peptidoglycan transpeptidase YkuD (ErfK/YbiS/YcfS/YnhG family)
VILPLLLALYASAMGLGLGLGLKSTLAEESSLQLMVATAAHTETHRGHLRLFNRPTPTSAWTPTSEFMPVLYGKNGLAWGRGLHPPQPGLQKQEGDGRAPMGRFRLGQIIGNDPHLPLGAKWDRYHAKTGREAWIDDPALPHLYNQFVVIPPGQPEPSWFNKNRMRLGDAAYHWLVVVEHNWPQPIVGAGSAIFLHVRRGENRPSGGCTVMARADLEKIVTWLDPSSAPQFVLLDANHYRKFAHAWQLPEASLALKTRAESESE